jgi:hypothetical protein
MRISLALAYLVIPIALVSIGRSWAAEEPATSSPTAQAAAAMDTIPSSGSKFIDPEDGWFDMSRFLDTGHGFIPLAAPVTEPAFGYGVGGGLVFLRANELPPNGVYRRPNMLAVGGLGTNDGTWAAFAAHIGSWKEDRIQTFVAALYASADLDFFGVGEGPLNDHPVPYDLAPAGGVAQARYRIGRSPAMVGIGYGLASVKVTVDTTSAPPEMQPLRTSRVGGLTPSFVYDSRDNVFTPLRGSYTSADVGVFRSWLGSSSDFERVQLNGIHHLPISQSVFLGTRVAAAFSFGDVPFYARPFVHLRGAPALRYMGKNAGSIEAEGRWQFWRRISVDGFAGVGTAWNQFERFDAQQNVVTGGGGFRYEIARRYGLHLGLDAAFGPIPPTLYFVFGNPWFRP